MHVNNYLHFEMDFLQRLELLLDGRKKYEWGSQLGLNRGVIAGMFDKGAMPGWDTLTTISRFENASIDWLTTGRGSPFYVHRYSSDEEAAEAINELLRSEGWAVVVGAAGTRRVIALHQPAQHQMRPKEGDPFWISYRMLELFANVGPCSVSLVAHHAANHEVRFAPLSEHQIDEIEQGRVGTRRLFLTDDAWLANATRITDKHPSLLALPDRPAALSPSESKWISDLRAMEPESRQHYLALAKTLSGKKPRM